VLKRDGADLRMTKTIPLVDALCGTKFTFTHLDGRVIEVKSPEDKTTRDGGSMTLVGFGMPKFVSN